MIFGKKEKVQRDLIVQYKRTFGSTEGKAVLLDIMNRNFILNSHKGDPFMEGRRAAILDIMSMANINMEAYDKLLKGAENE